MHARPLQRQVEVEIVAKAAVSIQEPRPGNAPVTYIGYQRAESRPPLQVRSADVGIQTDSIPALRQPIAKLDVFHRRTRERFIEPADRTQHLRSNRAEARPERGGRLVGLSMDERVRQVLRLRDEAGIGRGVVVGAENGRKLGVGVERGLHTGERFGVDGDVAVDEDDDFPSRCLRALVAGNRRAARSRNRHQARLVPRRDICTSVDGAVRHQHDLDSIGNLMRTRAQRDQAVFELGAVPMKRDDDSEQMISSGLLRAHSRQVAGSCLESVSRRARMLPKEVSSRHK